MDDLVTMKHRDTVATNCTHNSNPRLKMMGYWSRMKVVDET
jgi:hypothetical protein